MISPLSDRKVISTVMSVHPLLILLFLFISFRYKYLLPVTNQNLIVMIFSKQIPAAYFQQINKLIEETSLVARAHFTCIDLICTFAQTSPVFQKS